MRIFVDSNIVVSALVFNRKPLLVLERALEKHVEMVLSEEILKEVTLAVLELSPDSTHLLPEFIQKLEMKIVRKREYEREIENQAVRDVKDKHVIAAAIAANCDYILTGDNDLLELKIDTPKVIRTRDLLRLLEENLG